MNQELEKLKKENAKAWKIVEELEKDNAALTIGNRNALFNNSVLKADLDNRVGKLKTQIRKLGTDNKFLRKMILKFNSITPHQLESAIGNYRHKNQGKYNFNNIGISD